MKRFLPFLLLLSMLTGCSLIPKPVEFFQSKVHKVPEMSATQVEYQKRAAYLAKQRAAETVDAAISTGASTNVVTPARDAEKLTDAVSTSLGPPLSPSTNADTAVANLTHAVAKLDAKIEDFRKSNDVNAGKKIEGTGLLQIPYFVYLAVVVLVIVVGWHLAKTALSVAGMANPALAPLSAVGVGGMNIAGSLAGKAVTQVVSGGKNFLSWVNSEAAQLDPVLRQRITDAFTSAHKEAQDKDVRNVVDVVRK